LIFEQSIGSRGAAYRVSPRVEAGAYASMRSPDQPSSVDPAATKSPADCAAVRSASHGRQHSDTGNTGRSQNQDNTRRAASAAGPGGDSGRAFPGNQPDSPGRCTASFRCRVVSGGIPYRYGPVDGRCLCIFSGTPARSFATASWCALWHSYLALMPDAV
jgi:hypothetical protein